MIKPMNIKPISKDFEGMWEFGLDEEGGGRRTSRARKQVNYALPNLRDKMRREDKPEDGIRGRSISMDRSVTPDQGLVHPYEFR
jgi:Shugoshin C terminus